MKIEIRGLKYFAAGSQETQCFTATVYVDCQRVGTAENAGHGGMTMLRVDRDVERRMEEYVSMLPPKVYFGAEFRQTVDSVIDELVARELTRRDMKRALRTRFLFTVADRPGVIRQTNVFSANEMARWMREENRAQVVAGLKGADRVLNFMPEDDALRIYEEMPAG